MKWTREPSDDGRWELFLKERPAPVKQVLPEENSPPPDPAITVGPARYASQIRAAATANNIDAALIRAVISVESGYNPSAVSSAGAVGLMQLMPETAERYGVRNRLDPAQNIHGGARYLRDLLAMFKNKIHLAVAAYNAGENAVIRYGNRVPPFRETLAYVPRVMKFYQQFSGGTRAGEAAATLADNAPANSDRAGRVSMIYPASPD